jgi:rubredoxin
MTKKAESVHFDQRPATPVKVTCPHCGNDVTTPDEEPWLIHGEQKFKPVLKAFRCPLCRGEIRLDN